MVKQLSIRLYRRVPRFPSGEGLIPAVGSAGDPVSAASAADQVSAASAAGHQAEEVQAGLGNCVENQGDVVKNLDFMFHCFCLIVHSKKPHEQ